MRRRAAFVPLFFFAALLTAPTVTACSLAPAGSLSSFMWLDEDRFLTPYLSGFGIFDLTERNFTLNFTTLFVTDAVVSPDAKWLVVSYWNGALDADCSHDVEVTDAFDLDTFERTPLAPRAAHAFAPNRDGVAVFGAHDEPLFYTWGEWAPPSHLTIDHSTRPDLRLRAAEHAAISPDGTWLALFLNHRVYVFRTDGSDGPAFEQAYPVDFYPEANPFAFSEDSRFLVWTAPEPGSLIEVLELRDDGVTIVTSRADPTHAGGATITGGPTWGPDGIAVPMGSGLRLFPNASDLAQTREWQHGEEATTLGSPRWTPDGSRIIVGGWFLLPDGNSGTKFWILDDQLRDVDNYTLPEHPLSFANGPWQDIPTGNDDPSDDPFDADAPGPRHEFSAPAPGAVVLVSVVLIALVARHVLTGKKT
jgi:hypothetical protein